MKKCLVEGCNASTKSRYSGKEGRICDSHWFKLPMAIKKRWWDETRLSKVDPSAELIQVINEFHNPIEDVLVDSGLTGHPPTGKYAKGETNEEGGHQNLEGDLPGAS